MNESLAAGTGELRRFAYAVLIVLSAATMTGQILAVRSERGETPLLSANDCSRWCTIRALVDHGTYAIDEVSRRRVNGKLVDYEWHTIDMVKHVDRQGRLRSYSSKPPLLATLLAGEYWLVQQVTGLRIDERPFYVIRTMLILTNVLPMILLLTLIAAIVERLGTTDSGRVFVVAAAAFGTFLSPFAVTLNNHSPAAVATAIAIYAALPIWLDGSRRWYWYSLAGGAAAFAAANELPALALLGLLGLLLLCKRPMPTLLFGAPAALLVAAAALGANYLAHDSWRPPYAHRGAGPLVATLALDAPVAGALNAEYRQAFADAGLELSDQAYLELLPERAEEREPAAASQDQETSSAVAAPRWVLWAQPAGRRWGLEQAAGSLQVREWDNWYEFPGSYWSYAEKVGVDRGERSRARYALHVLIGHHGLLSLTPVWLLTIVGLWFMVRSENPRLRELAGLIILLTVVVLVFYIFRPLKDRNYGGVTTCLRWMLWFTPLWLIGMIPAADAMCRARFPRLLALTLLAASTLSAATAYADPWVNPWLYRFWQYLEWIE